MISLRKLAKAHNLRQRELAEILKTDQSVVSLVVNGHRRLNEDQIELLRARFGDEELAKFDAPEEVRHTTADLTFYSPELVEEVREELREEMRNNPKREDVETLEESVAIAEPVIVPPSIMQRPETDAKEWVESREAQANADRLQIAGILKVTDMVWKVEDEAMRPTLFQGEFVLIKEMDDNAEIVDGRVYAIDTKYHGNLIRRVYDEGDSYRLEPINKDGYSSVSINKDGGYNRRYRILCHLSTEISILPDVDEERRRQDRLIDEVSRAGGRVDRLIDLLEKKN